MAIIYFHDSKMPSGSVYVNGNLYSVYIPYQPTPVYPQLTPEQIAARKQRKALKKEKKIEKRALKKERKIKKRALKRERKIKKRASKREKQIFDFNF